MKNKIILLMLLSFITAFSYQESYEVLAHSEMLDISYDACVPAYYVNSNNVGDGIDEKWYELISADNFCHHIYHNENKKTKVINYHVSPINHEDDSASASWDDIINLEDREKLLTNIIQGIKAWENIYYYCIDDETNMLTKTKVFEFNNSTIDDADVIIYPSASISNPAETGGLRKYGFSELQVINNIKHRHYSKWKIQINLSLSSSDIDTIKLTGSHEFGHVIGLRDIDNVEESHMNTQSQNYVQHHEELLMGYGVNNDFKKITYKDIAGTMITMGFHTNNDHKWMYIENQDIIDVKTGNIITNDGYKLICSICNGYKYSTTLPNGSVKFEQCKNPNTDISDHSLSSGNMMAVASYDNYDEHGNEYDYYKCKYCRYVAPFSANEEQIYGSRTYIPNNTNQHYLPSLSELDYNLLEDHYSDYQTNTYEPYSLSDSRYFTKHIYKCGCNEIQTSRPHSFSANDISDGGAYNTCIDCRVMIRVNSGGQGIIVGPLNENIWQVTDNGSYKQTNGIIILVEEDIQAYKEGTLVFKDANNEIM